MLQLNLHQRADIVRNKSLSGMKHFWVSLNSHFTPDNRAAVTEIATGVNERNWH